MSYGEIYDLISRYTPEVLSDYADAFSRFPCGANAANIAAALTRRASFYRGLNYTVSKKLEQAASEILMQDQLSAV